ncbi:MAG: hypothetical protein V3V47_07955 [Desulfobacteria bacterium]
MTEQDREIAWTKAAKGRGNRWQILRDVVALLSVKSMNMMMIQDCMLKLRGTTRGKVREFLEDLERAKAIHQVTGKVRGGIVHGWSATSQGVSYWVGSRTDIPVRIAQVASTIDFVVIGGR